MGNSEKILVEIIKNMINGIVCRIELYEELEKDFLKLLVDHQLDCVIFDYLYKSNSQLFKTCAIFQNWFVMYIHKMKEHE